MGFVLLAAFIGVPLIEIGLFIEVGGLIGLWPTIAVVILTAMAGAALLRHQGLGALARLQQSLDNGEPPVDPVFDGFCLLAAGMLLLTPGFFTDAVGFLLFVPPVRAGLKRLLANRIQMHTAASGHTQAHTQSGEAQFHWHSGGPSADPTSNIIDGDYQDVTDKSKRPRLPDDVNDGQAKP